MFNEVSNYYENYDEDNRLVKDNAHKVEFLTTLRYFDKLFAPESKILDACAGTGRYSFYLADKGHVVTACDLVSHNVDIIKSKPNADKLADISVENTLDLSRFNENSFDVVLNMGALYHIREKELRKKAVLECVRVCKPGGLVVLAYITKVGAVLACINEDSSNMDAMIKIIDDTDEGPFFCAAPKEIDEMAVNCGLKKVCHIGVDGMSERVLGNKLNAATDENFAKYMEYHYLTCEDESIIGTSCHGLWIGRKI